MRNKAIVVTEADARVLRSLLERRAGTLHDAEHLHELALELERAIVLEHDQLPFKVVTLNKQVEVLDLESGARHSFTLVSPVQADVSARRISVLAPLGTAVLGYSEGDQVEWLMPGGFRRLRIERVFDASPAGLAAKPADLATSAH